MRALYRHLEEIHGSLLLVGICAVTIAQVASRYLMESPLAWTEELATMLFAWLVFIGAALALKRGEHFALDLFVDLLPALPRRLARLAGIVAVGAFCLLITGYGFVLARDSWTVDTAVLEIPRTWLYASVPCGGRLST